MKKYIRTLWGDDMRPLWDNEDQREGLRRYLNDIGFYVLTGIGDSLDIHAISYQMPLDVKMVNKVLDGIQKEWYKYIQK